jgi:hypothetical protein
MEIEGPKLSPGKGRWPKSERKQALRKYRLNAATEYKRAAERRKYGTLGAASPVRRIDPATVRIAFESNKGSRHDR